MLSAAENGNDNLSPTVFFIDSSLGSKNAAEEKPQKKNEKKLILFSSLPCSDRQTEEP